MAKINNFNADQIFPPFGTSQTRDKVTTPKCCKATLFASNHSPNSTTALQTSTCMSSISYKLTSLLDHSYLLCKATQSDCGFVFMVELLEKIPCVDVLFGLLVFVMLVDVCVMLVGVYIHVSVWCQLVQMCGVCDVGLCECMTLAGEISTERS